MTAPTPALLPHVDDAPPLTAPTPARYLPSSTESDEVAMRYNKINGYLISIVQERDRLCASFLCWRARRR
jgi:hypothetical protein